ncbi:MAG: hypothetical protein ABI696_00975 [Rubrivivax sp.]
MNRTSALGRSPRIVAAALAAGLTWAVFGSVVSIGAPEHDQLVAAIAARQEADTPTLLAALPDASGPWMIAVAP